MNYITRKDGWERELREHFDSVRTKPYAWGEHDCCLHAANAILALTGADLADGFRGTYSDASGAARVMQTYALGDVEALAVKRTAEYSMREIPVLMAHRGDLVLVDLESTKTLAIVDFDGLHALGVGDEGLVALPLRSARRAWRV